MPILADAFDIQEASIVTLENNQVVKHGFVSGVTIDGRRPEDFVNVIGGQVRRRKPEETEWNVDAVVLYDNITTLKRLRNQKFDIQIEMIDPMSLPENGGSGRSGQKLTVYGCRIAEENITVSDGSTMKMSGKADRWDVEPIGSSQSGSILLQA